MCIHTKKYSKIHFANEKQGNKQNHHVIIRKIAAPESRASGHQALKHPVGHQGPQLGTSSLCHLSFPTNFVVQWITITIHTVEADLTKHYVKVTTRSYPCNLYFGTDRVRQVNTWTEILILGEVVYFGVFFNLHLKKLSL